MRMIYNPQIPGLTSAQITTAAMSNIFFPTQLPLFSSPPNKENIQRWVQRHQFSAQPLLGSIARKLADNINYISFEKFLSQLQITIAHFHQSLDKNEPYILCVPPLNRHPRSIKSQHCVAGLAIEHCKLRFPTAITQPYSIDQTLKKYPNVKTILILDDASYSATQLCEEISDLLKNAEGKLQEFNIYISIPYQTKNARIQLSNRFYFKFEEIVILNHQPMLLLNEILSAEELTYLRGHSNLHGDLSLTYFDHVFPDCYSTVAQIETGLVITHLLDFMRLHGYHANDYVNKEVEWNELIKRIISEPTEPLTPRIIRPYYYNDQQSLDTLEIAIKENNIGARNFHALTDRFPLAHELLIKYNLLNPDVAKTAKKDEQKTKISEAISLTLLSLPHQQTTSSAAQSDEVFKSPKP